MKPRKYLLGVMIKEWDNRESQTVADFNEFFEEILPYGKPSAQVTIGAPYTHNGRLLTVEGVEGEIQFLFSMTYNILSKKRIIYKYYVKDQLKSIHTSLDDLCVTYKFSRQTGYKIVREEYAGENYQNIKIVREDRETGF